MATSKLSAAEVQRLRKALWRLISKPAPITAHDGLVMIVLDAKQTKELTLAIESLIHFAETFAALKQR